MWLVKLVLRHLWSESMYGMLYVIRLLVKRDLAGLRRGDFTNWITFSTLRRISKVHMYLAFLFGEDLNQFDKKRQERTDYIMILLQYSISSIYSNA